MRSLKPFCQILNSVIAILNRWRGGSVLCAMAPHFETALAGDVHEDLILMYQALQQGWVPPEDISEKQYQDIKRSEPSALRGFVGFGCSFGGRWFEGYARGGGANYAAQSKRNVMAQRKSFGNVHFERKDYTSWSVSTGDVVYLDPPYAGTKFYSGTAKLDYDQLWGTARMWRDQGAHVYVSEFTAPNDWTAIWEKERKVGVGTQSNAQYSTRTDRLFK